MYKSVLNGKKNISQTFASKGLEYIKKWQLEKINVKVLQHICFIKNKNPPWTYSPAVFTVFFVFLTAFLAVINCPLFLIQRKKLLNIK